MTTQIKLDIVETEFKGNKIVKVLCKNDVNSLNLAIKQKIKFICNGFVFIGKVQELSANSVVLKLKTLRRCKDYEA